MVKKHLAELLRLRRHSKEKPKKEQRSITRYFSGINDKTARVWKKNEIDVQLHTLAKTTHGVIPLFLETNPYYFGRVKNLDSFLERHKKIGLGFKILKAFRQPKPNQIACATAIK